VSRSRTRPARWLPRHSEWRREVWRASLWLIPSLQVVAVGALFTVTYLLDRAAYNGDARLPSWVNSGTADASRQILTAIAAAIITVAGLVFSITIVAFTLASTQFGPRILRNFVRDRSTQVTLGAFVATFVYAVLALGSFSPGARGEFVPHLSITVALGMGIADVGLLIFFIHHVATSIQLPQVIASIARDLGAAIEVEVHSADPSAGQAGPSEGELLRSIHESGAVVRASHSGYLQFIGYPTLVEIATRADAVIWIPYRPGHFVVEGLPFARVWPAEAAPQVSRSLARAHATGAHRTLAQDLLLAIDQLVEIALRALSPAVNDTFTALTCIDWLSDGLSKLAARWKIQPVHRDRQGYIRLVTTGASFSRMVERAFAKIRQAGTGMPAVMIRQLDALAKVMEHTTNDSQRSVLLEQADMILRSSEASVPEPRDRIDVRRRYDATLAAHSAVTAHAQLLAGQRVGTDLDEAEPEPKAR
jgi:uncharacterized membrane protein